MAKPPRPTNSAETATTVRQVDTVALRSVRLWDGDAPLAKGTAPEDRPHLDVLLAPKERATGCAIIICPGGGFRERAIRTKERRRWSLAPDPR
jgi:hypothetical protein